MLRIFFIPLVVLLLPPAWASSDERLKQFVALEQAGVVIGAIEVQRGNVFDTTIKKESSGVYRFTNSMHIVTQERVIRAQLLFSEGQPLQAVALAETERNLRNNKYLYSAEIIPKEVIDGKVDLLIKTKDLWTLSPELGFQRAGNENYLTIGIEDDNFLGTGASLTVSREENIDRTSNILLYSNRYFLSSQVQLKFGIADSDDGSSYSLGVSKPFHSLDTPWSASGDFLSFDGVQPLYVDGDDIGEYRQDTRAFTLQRGWSTGRRNAWVRRISAGISAEDSTFSFTNNPLLAVNKPNDREIYYPYISLQLLEDKFVTTQNYRGIRRTEDVFLGTQYTALLGYASTDLGSDRDALILSAGMTSNYGNPNTKLFSFGVNASTRVEDGEPRNFLSSAALTYLYRFSDRWQFLGQLNLRHNERPDLDRLITLGGSTGLRGYPVRYRNGRGSGLFTIEQRYFSDLYPFRVFRLGGAVFFDAGTVWGRNVLGEKNRDFLSDFGFGIRLASTRGGSKKVIHIDVAFPLNDDPSIDNVQILVEAKDKF